MTQEQLVDICRLMDINKDGFVDLNEFLESFRLAEKSLDDDGEMEMSNATWHEPDRRPSQTAVDRDETGVQVELLQLEKEDLVKVKRNANDWMGDRIIGEIEGDDDIELIDCDEPPKRKGLLESNMWNGNAKSIYNR